MTGRPMSAMAHGGAVLLRAIALCALCHGCGAESHGGGGTDSSTHWLQHCEGDDDCGALSCLCGACSVACEQDAACGELSAAATCRVPARECEDEAAPACVQECASDGDCPSGAPRCEAGQCAAVPGNSAAGAGAGGCEVATDCGDGLACEGGACVAVSIPGRLECTAMDARPSGDDCIMLEGHAFDGSDCVEIHCGCEGTECDRLYASRLDCLTDYAHCGDTGPNPFCDSDADCGDAERCFSGTCGPSCEDYTQCGAEARCFADEPESCLPYVIDVGEPATGSCLPRCFSDADCIAVAPGLTCWGSACVRLPPPCERACPRIASSCPAECSSIQSAPYDQTLMCRGAPEILGCVPSGRASTSDDACAVGPEGDVYNLSGSDAGHLIRWGAYTECTQAQFDAVNSNTPSCN